MLAQSFLSADDLGITEPQREALMKTLVLLETGKLVHVAPSNKSAGEYRQEGEFTGHFNMARWRGADDCGTICCIAGTAELIGSVTFQIKPRGQLGNLFWGGNNHFGDSLAAITPTQAARALRSYLNCGDAKWSEALA